MHIGIERLSPVVQGDVVEGFVVALIRGVIDQDVQAPKFASDLLDERFSLGVVADVAGAQDGLLARLFYEGPNAGGILLLALKERDSHIGAFPGVGNGYCRTNTAVAAGNQRFLAFQHAVTNVAVLTVVWPRVELVGFAGKRLLLRLEWRLRVVGHGHWLSLYGVEEKSVCGRLGKRRGPVMSMRCAGA